MSEDTYSGPALGAQHGGTPPPRPSKGRIVLVRGYDDSEEWPAIITSVHNEDYVSVVQFRNSEVRPMTSVSRQREVPGVVGWRWPERV